MSTSLPAHLTTFLDWASDSRYAPDQEAVALAVYREMAESGPVTEAAIARRAGLDEETVREILEPWSAMFRGDDGSIVGFVGLTVAALTHRIRFGDQERSAWCAWDTLFLPGVVGQRAHVVSKDPSTGVEIELDVAPDATVTSLSHPEAVLSFRAPPPEGLTDEVQKTFCHYVHFFESRDSAEGWLREHDDCFVLSIEDGAELARRVNAARYPTLLGS